ncbi:MAG: hypothetical protein HW403_1029 [Dehalococcoidia bacterium]|nr:hypothetical protein [Dehalococcoidia bacterium]
MRGIPKKGAMMALVALAVGLAAMGIFINSKGRLPQTLEGRPSASIGIGRPAEKAESTPPSPSASGGASIDRGLVPSTGDTTAVQDSIIERMIVYNTSISLEVQDVQSAMSTVTRIALGAGGYVSGTSSHYQGKEMVATTTIRVPAGVYSQVMADLRALGLRVVLENGSAQDVSEQYTDLQAQLRNLESTEAQYLELMKRANTIDEILRVQQRLSEVRGQIERVKGRMNYLERTSEMAMITVSLMPEGAYTTGPRPRWDPKGAAQESWAASIEILQAMALTAIRVAVFSWWFIPLLLVAVIWGLQRTSRRPSAG